VTNHHARLAVETRQATDDRLVIGIRAVAVQLMEVREDFVHVVHGVGTLRMTRDLGYLPGRELGVEVFGELLTFLREAVDLFADIDGGVFLNETQLFDF
jgi:hypothetical protein